MRKLIYTFFVSLIALGAFAGNYGILVNGKTYYAGEPAGEYEVFNQYLAHVNVKEGDYCQLYDAEYKARWAVTLNSYSVGGFTYDAANQRYTVSVTGC